MGRYQGILKYIFRQWRALLLIITLTVVASAIAAIAPLPMKLLVDYGLTQGGIPLSQDVPQLVEQINTPAVLIVTAALSSIAIFGLNSVIEFKLTMTWTTAGQQMVADLSSDLFEHLQRLSLQFHSHADTGDNISRLSHDTYSVYTIAETLLISPLKHVFTLVFIGLVAWRMSPNLTLLSLIVAPLLSASAFFFGNRIKLYSSQNRAAESRLLSFVHQTLTSIPIVQAFGTEGRNQSHFNSLASDAVILSQKRSLTLNQYQLLNGAIMTTGSAIVLFFGARYVLLDTLKLGSFLVLITYLKSMQSAFSGIFGIYGSLRSIEANADRVAELQELDQIVQEKPDAKAYQIQWAGMDGRVRMEGVTFGYETNHPILQGIDIEIEPGETVALVGKTGVGKSTLASLIPRFFDPWEGSVIVNEMDVRDMQISSLREQIALVLQDSYLLPTTIAENIAFGNPDANRAMIQEVAELARAAEFIRKLPRGYETVIGEYGYSLSGGEKQRIAIARAILKDAPILILDEPTSAIDSQTEDELLVALEALMEGRTTLVIAHRLSTVQRADRILVLDNGKIVETGTHDELLSGNGKYARLHEYQQNAGKLEKVK